MCLSHSLRSQTTIRTLGCVCAPGGGEPRFHLWFSPERLCIRTRTPRPPTPAHLFCLLVFHSLSGVFGGSTHTHKHTHIRVFKTGSRFIGLHRGGQLGRLMSSYVCRISVMGPIHAYTRRSFVSFVYKLQTIPPICVNRWQLCVNVNVFVCVCVVSGGVCVCVWCKLRQTYSYSYT